MMPHTIRCDLCPNFCLLEEGKIGRCLSRKAEQGKVVLSSFGMLSCVSVEPIEKKPFRYFLKGTNTLSIGGQGCNLSCKFCENYKISQCPPTDRHLILYPFTPDAVVELALENCCQSICMTYNEPTIYYEYLLMLSSLARKNNLKFIIKTNAYLNQDPWLQVCNNVDAMNIDWKGSEKLFKFITSSENYVYEDRIKEAYNKHVRMEISVPLYYESEDLESEMEYFGKFISSVDRRIPCHLLKISPSYKYENFVFNNKHIKQAKKILSQYIDNIHV